MVYINSPPSEFFNCKVGVRQSENLFPPLFSKVLQEFRANKNVHRHSTNSSIENQCLLYSKLFILFNVDDTVIISESADHLEHALDEFHSYSIELWKLNLNVDKTKIMVFSKGLSAKQCILL